MESAGFIALCIVLGMLLARSRGATEYLAPSLASFAVRVSLPALVLQRLHALALDPDILLPLFMPPLVFAIVAAFALGLGRAIGLKRETIGCLILVCGTGNTTIVGVPLIQALLGEAAVGYALVADQANFLVLSLLGMPVANVFAPRADKANAVLWDIFTYPPVIAMIAALMLKGVAFPGWLDHFLSMLAATLTPVAIVSIGAGLRLRQMGSRFHDLATGLSIKLVLAPAVIFFLYASLVPSSGTAFATTILQAATPPMIVATLIAMERKLDPQLAFLLSGLGIPLSLITSFLWSCVFR